MNAVVLKLLLLSFFSFLHSWGVQAQKQRFIFIQSENKQAFYVKIDKKILSSSESGYTIVTGLNSDVNKLTIGFPGNEWPEFQVNINTNDTGYLLKKLADSGWTMVAIQHSVLPVKQPDNPVKEEKIKSFDIEFARVLAEVVNDPAIARVGVVKKTVEAVKQVTQLEVAQAPASKEAIPGDLPFLQSMDTATVKSEITRLTQDSTAGGILIRYMDKLKALADTVSIFIPFNRVDSIPVSAAQDQLVAVYAAKTDTTGLDKRFIDMELQNPNRQADSGAVKKDDFVISKKKAASSNARDTLLSESAAVSDSSQFIISAVCKKTASQNDFLKLRKNMAASPTEEAMLQLAYKELKKTCVSTEQLKNLGVLFINEAARYQFYEQAYPYVTDKNNFGNLEEQLKEEVNKALFKSMHGH